VCVCVCVCVRAIASVDTFLKLHARRKFVHIPQYGIFFSSVSYFHILGQREEELGHGTSQSWLGACEHILFLT
jgi:hypothetical protein